MQIDRMFVFLDSDARMTLRKQCSKMTLFIVGCVPAVVCLILSNNSKMKFHLQENAGRGGHSTPISFDREVHIPATPRGSFLFQLRSWTVLVLSELPPNELSYH